MATFTRLVSVSIIVVCGLLTDLIAREQAANARPDARIVLDKVRDTYRSMPGYHFERVVLVQELGTGSTPANIAEMSLTLATEKAQPVADDRPFPVNFDRFRLRTKTKQGEQLQLCDGRTCWSYASAKNEYMTGNSFRDVNTSVGGSMLMAFHLFTFSTVEQGVLQDAKIVREEEIEVGTERRRCHVIEGRIQTTMPRPGASPKPPSVASLGVMWFVSLLTMQGQSEEARTTRYSAWADEAAAGTGEPTQVTLWIDQTNHVIVRSQMASQLFKRTAGNVQAAEKVSVTLTDRFSIASVKAPPEDLFRFTPPEGAKEVPNVRSRRDVKK